VNARNLRDLLGRECLVLAERAQDQAAPGSDAISRGVRMAVCGHAEAPVIYHQFLSY
jgi:hypothetical protein